MKSKTSRHGLKRMTALLLAVVLCVGMVPTAFAAQQDSYHDPAENWQEANNRTNELDANATVTHETFNCKVCKQQTSFIVFRTPEYTRDGQTAMSRNVKYSDGTFVDGSGKGSILDGVPGQDAYYTAYHWTKAVCETCGSINTNMAKTDYGYLKNVYWLYDCANNFFEELPETQTIEQADSEYHRVITTSGEYCGFCYGTFKEENSTLERHHMENAIRPELAHDRFVEMDTCADCGYAETSYTAAKAVIADYFGVVDGQPHTVTVSDLSEAGVTTAIRYGHSADACTLTSAPNYTEAGDYPVYYEITYTYHDTDMVEDGVAYVHLRDETTTEDGSCTCGCGNPDCGCQDPDCDGCCCDDKGCGENHNWTLLDSVDPTCLTLGYDRYLCVDCGMIEKRDYIRDEKDALRLVNNLIQATTPKNSHESDPFWTKAETALLQAIILMLFQEAPESEQNFSMVMRVLEYAEVKEDDEDHVSPLDLLFSAIEREKPDSVAVRQYKVFKMAAGKTSKSILVSTAVRLAPFNLPQIRAITDHDDMDLYTLGEKKCALYAVIPDNDNTYNFLVSLLYSQVFQTLYYCADQIHHGPLPRHVHFILDEAPSVNLPGLPRELATMRSRNISCSTIIQNMAQIKEQFKDSWETIPGNSDTLLYLGGNESSTHKYISEALGKSTIDTKTHGETKGKSGSWSTNMQISGRELLTPDEVRRLDNRYAILLIRGTGPVMDLKYDLMKHPAVRQTSLAGGPPYIHHRQNQAPVISGHEFFAAFSTDDTNENKENAA